MAVPLARESGWDGAGTKKGPFRVIRFNCLLDEYDFAGTPRYGEVIGLHENHPGTSVELIDEITVDLEETSLRTVLREDVFTDELVTAVNSELGTAVGTTGIFKASSKLKSGVTQKFTERVMTQASFQQTNRKVERHRLQITYQIDGASAKEQVSVMTYRERKVDVYLVYIDFLEVHYERAAMGLRRKRVKSPPLLSGNEVRANELLLSLPLGTFSYWEPAPRSSVMIPKSKYSNEVGDPSLVRRVDVLQPRSVFRDKFPRTPSLYQLANAAFPLKWVKRVGDWTEEELMKIELDEAHNTAWWFRNHHPKDE